ncbi:MAG: hypothetical protein IT301_05035 [Dehalococcoidia bacterium]|nr:hypothetical protein [Dehalococcoidia bacterium]
MNEPSAVPVSRPSLAVLAHEGFPEEQLIDVLELCRSFAGFLGQPVAFGRGLETPLHETLGELSAGAGRWNFDFVAPPTMTAASMSSADFVYTEDGRPDWGAMWTGFCELALYGGPPHRGEESALNARLEGEPTPGLDAIREIRRGIFETTGLFAEPYAPGWLAVTCHSGRMAAWLAASIILENVEARFDGEMLLVPAHESFTLKNEVKSVITVVAKTNHYWQAHVAAREQAAAAEAAG